MPSDANLSKPLFWWGCWILKRHGCWNGWEQTSDGFDDSALLLERSFLSIYVCKTVFLLPHPCQLQRLHWRLFSQNMQTIRFHIWCIFCRKSEIRDESRHAGFLWFFSVSFGSLICFKNLGTTLSTWH